MCPTVWFYLAEIYRIQERCQVAKISMIADAMDVSVQAASRMVRRMTDDGHLLHIPYQGTRLTPSGERIALAMIRRHRIQEAYLVTALRFGWDEVHDLVESLEKGIEERVVERMYELAGHPARCPHGEPIPTANGEMPVIHDRVLVEWPEATPCVVSRVRTHNPEMLRYLASVELVPGASLHVVRHAPFNGPVFIERESGRLTVGNHLAQQVFVMAPA
ncbi:MAG: metal-dependent transcriptional regulator [Anaerolineae bacterium]|nr:metal-dependent transcriptional regulator [Anaerolineae bacterium]